MARYFELTRDSSKVLEIEPKNDKKYDLEDVQALVGGYVELVHLNGDNIMLLDEDGLLKNKPVNMQATIHAEQLGWQGGLLVGSVLFCRDSEF